MNSILAAFIFFPRLPLWRVVSPPKEAYSNVVVYWPLVGWLTGGAAALIMLGLSAVMPWLPAIVIGLVFRLLITGSLHEDGLADFCDAFGCGGSRERMLAIMKDSHIGTYGVIGLILYYILTVSLLAEMTPWVGACVFFAADSFTRFCGAQTIGFLHYARPEGPKNGITYSGMSPGQRILCALFGIVPLLISSYLIGYRLLFACILPVLSIIFLLELMRRKLGGYTGDCCGAAYLICEVMFLVGASVIYFLY